MTRTLITLTFSALTLIALAQQCRAVDFNSVMSLSGCGVPRTVHDGVEPRRCVNRLPEFGKKFSDICTREDSLNRYDLKQAEADVLRPEWSTLAVAGGPGMHGVRPFGCLRLPEQVIRPFAELNSQLAAATVALVPDIGSKRETLGTALLIAKDILLTARHVVFPEETENKIAFAKFGYRNRDLHAPGWLRGTVFTRVVPHSGTSFAVLDGGVLDYALLKISKSDPGVGSEHDTKPIELPIWSVVGDQRPRGSPTVAGYTDNPFFPRGLLVSTGYRWHPPPLNVQGMRDVFYDATTASGFSGGPIVDGTGRLVGIHAGVQVSAHLNMPIDTNMPGVAIVDHSQPSGGLLLSTILTDVAKRCNDGDIKEMFGDDDRARAVRTYGLPPPNGESCLHPSERVQTETRTVHNMNFDLPGIGSTLNPSWRDCRWRYDMYPSPTDVSAPCRYVWDNSAAPQWFPNWSDRGRPLVGALFYGDRFLSSAILVGPSTVLTTAHTIPAWHPDVVAHLEFRMQTDSSNCAYSVAVSEWLSESAPSRRDFLFLKLKTSLDVDHLDACGWRGFSGIGKPEAFHAAAGYFDGHVGASNLHYFEGKHAVNVRRWPKDGGGTLNLDYWIFSEKGLSGGALLDDSMRLIGMHQRSLSTAFQETLTRWHPYADHWYRHATAEPPECKKIVDARKLTANNCLPAQGTSIEDIASDVASDVGVATLCEIAPTLHAALPRPQRVECKKSHPLFQMAGEKQR